MRFSSSVFLTGFVPLQSAGFRTALVFCLATVLAGPGLSHAQQAAAGANAIAAGPAKAASGAARPASTRARTNTSPTWAELTPEQQQALAPLSATWPTISETQKRKWLVVSRRFGKLLPEEQAKLHSRMTEWATLSPQQRTQARLNFATTRKLSSDDKKAKWEAYQALPPEEKRKLAASAPKPPATAAAVKPVPAQKLLSLPKTGDARSRRSGAASSQVDHNTLLPQPAPPAAPAPVR